MAEFISIILSILGFVFWVIVMASPTNPPKKTTSLKPKKVKDTDYARLEQLGRELIYTSGDRDQKIFDKLRTEYELFKKEVINKNLYIQNDILTKVDALFEACVKELWRNCELSRAERKITKRDATSLKRKSKLSARRNKILDEVDKTASKMEKLIDQFEGAVDNERGSQLEKLNEELDQNIEIARRVEERMEEFERKPDEKHPDAL